VLVVLGAGTLLGLTHSFATGLEAAADATGLFWARHLVARGVAKLFSLDAHERRVLGVACLAYAGVFTVEGVGLVLRKAWAEWLTVVVTGSFVPLEVYEVAHRPGWGKAVALALNLAIAAYLVACIRRRRAVARA
jgi:uncharacterized membrane protein (DUF2068 family)